MRAIRIWIRLLPGLSGPASERYDSRLRGGYPQPLEMEPGA